MELIRMVWFMLWLIPDLPELIEQGKYEEDLQTGKIG
jgi:hypothetical protein